MYICMCACVCASVRVRASMYAPLLERQLAASQGTLPPPGPGPFQCLTRAGPAHAVPPAELVRPYDTPVLRQRVCACIVLCVCARASGGARVRVCARACPFGWWPGGVGHLTREIWRARSAMTRWCCTLSTPPTHTHTVTHPANRPPSHRPHPTPPLPTLAPAPG